MSVFHITLTSFTQITESSRVIGAYFLPLFQVLRREEYRRLRGCVCDDTGNGAERPGSHTRKYRDDEVVGCNAGECAAATGERSRQQPTDESGEQRQRGSARECSRL